MRKASEYTAIVRQKVEGGKAYYEATLQEFGEGVVIDAASPEEALRNVYETGEFVIADLVEEGETLPEPQLPHPWMGFSGKITLRMPKSLHYKLWMLANDEGVSLNSLVVKILSEGAKNKHCLLRPIVPANQAFVQNALFVQGSLETPAPLASRLFEGPGIGVRQQLLAGRLG